LRYNCSKTNQGDDFMAKTIQQHTALSILKRSAKPLHMTDLVERLGREVPGRTLRRWVASWVEEGLLERIGEGRASRYQCYISPEAEGDIAADSFRFLQGLDADLKRGLLSQIRDLWSHTSTALEGNTLSLGDTHFILEQGLTISGKPIKDHQEILGHAKAIELLYQCLEQPLTQDDIFNLHRAVQTEKVFDIYKPIGAWKNEINGTYAIAPDGKQCFIEYAMPFMVPPLMAEVINFINADDHKNIPLERAHEVYAKTHMGIVHVHPFWDGNGRIARLLANIPLLKSGLPPLIIPQEERRAYIQTLADYQLDIGQLTKNGGVWPTPEKLTVFSQFCESCYGGTQALIEQAFELQEKR
jgi:Fic/DOC family